MDEIINKQNDIFKKGKEKLNFFLKILKKNKNKLEEHHISNLQLKLLLLNNKFEDIFELLDNILIDLNDHECEMDEQTIIELDEIKNMNDIISELKPFLLLYQLSKNSIGPVLYSPPLSNGHLDGLIMISKSFTSFIIPLITKGAEP